MGVSLEKHKHKSAAQFIFNIQVSQVSESAWSRQVHSLKQSLLSEQTFKSGGSLVSKSVIPLNGFHLNAWNKVCGD